MCKCTPEIRTPFCGKPGCSWETTPTIDGSVVMKIALPIAVEYFAAIGKAAGAVAKRNKCELFMRQVDNDMVFFERPFAKRVQS